MIHAYVSYHYVEAYVQRFCCTLRVQKIYNMRYFSKKEVAISTNKRLQYITDAKK